MNELPLVEQGARIVKERLDKLLTLGTPDAIALELAALNVKAECSSASKCAIAVDLLNAIAAELGPDHTLCVSVPGNYRIGVYDLSLDTGDPENRANVHYTGPKPDEPWDNIIDGFIMQFDYKKYPDLIKKDF